MGLVTTDVLGCSDDPRGQTPLAKSESGTRVNRYLILDNVNEQGVLPRG